MNAIEENILLIENASKGIRIVKTYALKIRNLVNEDARDKKLKLIAYSLAKKGYGYNLYQ